MRYCENTLCKVKKLDLPSQDGGSLFNISNSHSLGEIALKGLLNTGIYGARKGLAKAVKSDNAKRGVKKMASKYIDQALDSFMGDVSKKLDPGKIGGSVDIHKAILKVAPKKGFVMPGHRYTGPGNPLDEQLKYDPKTRRSMRLTMWTSFSKSSQVKMDIIFRILNT